MKSIIALVFALHAIAANADDQVDTRFVNAWTASCKSAAGHYQIHFQSQSGDPTDDDMIVTIKRGKSGQQAIVLKPRLFVADRTTPAFASRCDKLHAVLLPDGDTLILIRRDDRPDLDRVAAVLLDARFQVIDVSDDIGQLDWPLQIERQPQGIRIRLIRQWIDAGPTVEPVPVAVWARVGERAHKVQLEWEDK